MNSSLSTVLFPTSMSQQKIVWLLLELNFKQVKFISTNYLTPGKSSKKVKIQSKELSNLFFCVNKIKFLLAFFSTSIELNTEIQIKIIFWILFKFYQIFSIIYTYYPIFLYKGLQFFTLTNSQHEITNHNSAQIMLDQII